MSLGRFLILDDDSPSRIVVGRALKRLGYDVDAASSAMEAQALVLRNGPAAYVGVVADLRMPQIDGLEFIDWLHGEDPTIAAVMLTAQRDLELEQWRSHSAVREVMFKPLDFERFGQVVPQLAQRTQSQRGATVSPGGS